MHPILQSEASECGLACLAMVSNHHGYEADLATLRRRFSISMKGTTMKAILLMAQKLGFCGRREQIYTMRRKLLLLTAVYFTFLTPSYATQEVRLRPGITGVQLTLSFPSPVNQVAFSWQSQGRRPQFWKMGDGLMAADDSIPLSAPASTVNLHLTEDGRIIDRAYPMLVPVDTGTWLVHTGYLFTNGADRVHAVIDTGSNGTAQGQGVHRDKSRTFVGTLDMDTSGYLLISTKSIVPDRKYICGNGMPDWLCAFMKDEGDRIERWYTQQMRSISGATPLLVATWHHNVGDVSGSWWRGDVSQNGVISLRFYGERWKTDDEDAKDEVRMFLAHEYFHLWQASTGNNDANTLFDIAREGSAEFASLLLARDMGWITESQMREKLVASANACADIAPSRGIAELPSAGSRLVYDCGNLLFWLRSQTDPTYVFDAWRRHNDLTPGIERADALRTMLMHQCQPAISACRHITSLLFETDAEKWARLYETMTVDDRLSIVDQTPQNYRRVAIQHALRVSCTTGPFGFWYLDGKVTLDTDDRCGQLSGNPDVVALNDMPLNGDEKQLYATVDKLCRSGDVVTFTTAGGEKRVGNACTRRLAPLPPRLATSLSRHSG